VRWTLVSINGFIISDESFFCCDTPTFFTINYILIESRSDILPSAYTGALSWYFDKNPSKQLRVANVWTEYNWWRYWIFSVRVRTLGEPIFRFCTFRRPLSRRYKFAFDCIATCIRRRMFGVKCARTDTGRHLPYLHGVSSIMSICRYGGDILRSSHWRASGTFMPNIG